jgi:hypothetical protein
MATATAPWPCPVCAGLLPGHPEDCPHCGTPAAWIDLLLALGFAVRQFHYWSIIGSLSKPQYAALVEDLRRRQEAMASAAQRGEPAPADAGLPPRSACWRCGRACGAAQICGACGAPLATPEARLFRYKTFLSHEVNDQAGQGRLTPAQAEQFLAETADGLADLRSRLAGA